MDGESRKKKKRKRREEEEEKDEASESRFFLLFRMPRGYQVELAWGANQRRGEDDIGVSTFCPSNEETECSMRLHMDITMAWLSGL